jgi:oxygen-dependent protoporphyrinogen oxidase
MSDVGLIDELVLADGSLPRFVYWNNELHALPSRLGEIAKFKLLSRTFIFVLCNNVILLCFLSVKGKLRAALGLLGIIKAKPRGDYEESIQEFATRHLGWFYLRHANASIHFHVVVHHSLSCCCSPFTGAEVFERVVDPFVSGVYAGDPRKLSISAALKKVISVVSVEPNISDECCLSFRRSSLWRTWAAPGDCSAGPSLS